MSRAYQKDGFAAMSTTIRISSAVSKRKIVNSRCTRRPTSAESGPNCCTAWSRESVNGWPPFLFVE